MRGSESSRAFIKSALRESSFSNSFLRDLLAGERSSLSSSSRVSGYVLDYS